MDKLIIATLLIFLTGCMGSQRYYDESMASYDRAFPYATAQQRWRYSESVIADINRQRQAASQSLMQTGAMVGTMSYTPAPNTRTCRFVNGWEVCN